MKKTIRIPLLLSFFLSLSCFSQNDGENPLPYVGKQPAEYFAVVDVQAEFPEGIYALAQTLKDSMRYPQTEKEKCIQGKINVEFYVDTTGKVIYAQAKDF